MRLLLVEDDERIASFIMKGFKEAGFVIDHAVDGETGLSMALAVAYDAAIVDIMLPKRDGISLIEELRLQRVNTPVLILSAKHSLDDRIRGIQRGGDDYLVKPFAFFELLVRVQALIRRASGRTEAVTLTYSDLVLDMYRREVRRSGVKIELPPREFALLEFLMGNAECIISKTMILEHVWNFNFDPQTNVVDVLVCRLRNKIDKDFPTKLIHTIRGIGYALKDPSKSL
ncbi:MAG: response regulator transcription factor [Proteobacteria bacterium]|nr:response regulator transcription factor [Pseudomonadota bacterium]